MDKEKIIIRLSTQINTLNAHINRLKKSGYKIHSLDVDMLRQKTIELYEMVFELETLVDKKIDLQKSAIVAPEKIAHKDIKEEVEVNIDESIEEVVKEELKVEVEVNKEEPVEEKIENWNNEVNKKTEVIVEPIITEPALTPLPKIKERKATQPPPLQAEERETVPEVKVENEEPDANQKPSNKSAYELFSSSTDNAVAEKYQTKEEQSIADKIQKSHISNIREAIGINEKFLFINELFSGDLGRYNKILDEINVLPTKKGVDTYLFELKIEFQWADDNEAYIKLKELLDRKFS